ncbi:MAG: hypothetical protein C4518_03260 [Desulfobacteraceae bacterium]|nr:MAG: hypothetical protein C4518_03260 [Desulfobacteraceae bacterium]
MKKIITQIYEIQTPAEAAAVIAAGVDHVGSVVVSPENWKVPSIRETIREVAKTAAKSSLILLYNQPDIVWASLTYYQPDIVHFCENLVDGCSRETQTSIEARCRPLVCLQQRIRADFPEVKIMRTIPIPDSHASADFPFLELAKIFEPVSDYFLTDTLIKGTSGSNDQPVEGFIGITGKTCDWIAARRLVESSRIPVVLAGGLSPENVYEGILATRPAGVDSCTLTNARDENGRPVRFKKDMEKVAQFVAEASRA